MSRVSLFAGVCAVLPVSVMFKYVNFSMTEIALCSAVSLCLFGGYLFSKP